MLLVEPDVIVRVPPVIVDVLVPRVVSYVTVDALPLVLAARLMAPVWLMMLLEVKLILLPLALTAIAPV